MSAMTAALELAPPAPPGAGAEVSPRLTRPRRRRTVGPGDFDSFSTAALHREVRRRRLASSHRDVRASARSATGRYVENAEYLASLRRQITAAGDRIGALDIAEFASLVALAAEVETAAGQAARGLHSRGFGWREIGEAIGIREQSAWRRFGPGRERPRADRPNKKEESDA